MGKADKPFLVEYRHNGATWCLDVYADDWEDAERKLRSIATNGRVIGEVQMTFSVPTWSERLFRWLGFHTERP